MAMFGPTPCLENKQQLLSDKFELTYSRQLHRCIPTTKHWESLHPNNGRCLRQLQLINPHLRESFATEYSTGTTFTMITLWDLYDISRCSTNPAHTLWQICTCNAKLMFSTIPECSQVPKYINICTVSGSQTGLFSIWSFRAISETGFPVKYSQTQHY